MKRLFSVTICCLGLIVAFPVMGKSQASQTSIFPRSQVIDVQVYFWKKVFAYISSQEGFLHDKELILPIYETVSLEGLTPNQVERKIDYRRHEIKKKLLALANDLESGVRLSIEQRNLLNKFYQGVTPKELRRCARRVRFQRGLSDRFQQGLVRSGAYLPYIHKTLKKYDLPQELSHLPHVESSFNLESVSKSGAMGIWQFIKRTGKEYMRVNAFIDERKDPFTSTEAAARLLKKNYELLGSWPLAITAYNYGPNGLARIIKKMGSNDLGYLIRHYKSRNFDFASKNFYAEFLAASEVAQNYRYYFGNFEFSPPLKYKQIRLPHSMHLRTIASLLDFPVQSLLKLNPALKPSIVQGLYPIPEYYQLKIPSQSKSTAHIESTLRKNSHSPKKAKGLMKKIRVRKGDSLYGIAKRYSVPLEKLAKLNRLPVKSPVIYPGQTLFLPRMNSDAQGASSDKKPRVRYIQVFKGDSLFGIAKRYGVNLKQLVAVNALNRDSTIYPGQKLKLPGKWLPSLIY